MGLCFPSLDCCLNIFRNILVDKVFSEEIPPQNDRQFLKVSMEPRPSVVYLKNSMNQGFDSPQFVGKGAKTQITGEQTCESLFPVNGGYTLVWVSVVN